MSSRALLFLSVCFVVCGCSGQTPAPDAPDSTTPVIDPIAGNAARMDIAVEASGGEGAKGQAPAGVKYVSRISEKKLNEFLEGLDKTAWAAVSEEQVRAIMGEPTRREGPITIQKNGKVFTVRTLYWEAPSSGVSSSVVFANGQIAGMMLGLEVTPHKPDGQ